MAFPGVRAYSKSASTDNLTDHIVSLPANIAAGDLLIVLFTSDGNPTIAFPEGWTQLFQTANGTAVVCGAWYRIADGEEGATITVTTTTGQRTTHISYRITNYSGVPEAGTAATATNDDPNPPSLTPSWGAKDTLWIAFEGNDGNVYVSNYVADYEDQWQLAMGATDCRSAVCVRELNAISENPGTFLISESEEWVANTIAIQPSDELSTLLRPNAGGTTTQNDYYDGSWHGPSAANNWQQVDEETPDDNSTRIANAEELAWTLDTYNLPNPGLSGTIAYVRVYARFYKGVYSGKGKIALRSGGTVYYGPEEQPYTVYLNFHTQWDLNPADSEPWEWADIDALEIGWAGIGGFHDIARDAYCTQVYVVVGYTLPPGWQGKISGVTNPAKIMGVDVLNIAKVKGVASA